jgi:hypothetical protein
LVEGVQAITRLPLEIPYETTETSQGSLNGGDSAEIRNCYLLKRILLYYFYMNLRLCRSERKFTRIKLYFNFSWYRTVKTLRLYYKNNIWTGRIM